MAANKVWSVYELGARYDGPLTEIEASSEKSALDNVASHFGVPRKRLYAVPGALLTGKPARSSHATKSARSSHATESPSERMVAKMIGRRVKSVWHNLVDGEIVEWEPFGAGGTDVRVKDAATGKEAWYASHGLTPIDGKGALPSRTKVRKLREDEVQKQMKAIGERWAKEPLPPRIRR